MVTHLFSHASDHRPLVSQMKVGWRNRRRLSRDFKFEEHGFFGRIVKKQFWKHGRTQEEPIQV